MRPPHRTGVTAVLTTVLVTLVLGGVPLASSPAQAAQRPPQQGHRYVPVRAHHSTYRSTYRITHHRTETFTSQVLNLVNGARSHGRSCGGTHYDAVGPVRPNLRLDRAASAFALKLGRVGFFDHVSPNGAGPGDRIAATGYDWRAYGENIAAGFTTPQTVVAGWLASPGHCANIMRHYRDMGVGYADVPHSPYGTYWVTDFGRL